MVLFPRDNNEETKNSSRARVFTSADRSPLVVIPHAGGRRQVGGGQGGGRLGEKGAGGVREAGGEGAGGGIPKVAGSGRKREKLRNIAQYFAIEKLQRGGSQKIQGGNRD